jgi:hypothetical protein
MEDTGRKGRGIFGNESRLVESSYESFESYFLFFLFHYYMPNYTNISITHLQTFEEIKRVIAVRHQVFVLEQGYSVEAESDK